MAYKPGEVDLKLKFYRNNKDHWRHLGESHLPRPKYKKPVIAAIELDRAAAVLNPCQTASPSWTHGGYCVDDIGTIAYSVCQHSVRGVRYKDYGSTFEVNVAPS